MNKLEKLHIDDSARLDVPDHGIPFGEAMRVWARVAALSFGGPAGQIAVMHKIIVEEKRWIGDTRFLHALNYCTLLPGPEAQQLATYMALSARSCDFGQVEERCGNTAAMIDS